MCDNIKYKKPESGGVITRAKPQLRVKMVRQSPANEGYSHPFANSIPVATSNVSNELEGLFQEWSCWQPVFIDAPTGTGKSTFVLDKLLPFIIEQRGRLLIISNRIALNTQYKHQVLKRYKHPALHLLTAQGIQEAQEFDNLPVTFCSYQGLPSLLRQEDRNFTHLVLDEAHYFCSDAIFAKDTGWLLRQIPVKFRGSVRIYMTATPWAVENMVAEEESKLPPPLWRQIDTFYHGTFYPYPPQLLVYQFPAVSRNYHLHVLPAEVRSNPLHPDLMNAIKVSSSKEKWLIFVDSKVYGWQLSKVLDNAAYLDANEKSGNTWEEITTTSRFSQRFLVTTSVADCGINIDDGAVKHVVLFSTDHVQFIQELGRKRLKQNEKVHLYVPELSNAQMAQLENRNNQLLQWLADYQSHPEKHRSQRLQEWYEADSAVRHLIPIDGNGRLHVNRCAEQVVRQRGILYQELRELQKNNQHFFLRMVCRWLNLPETALETAIDHTSETKLLKFLEKYCDTFLDSKEEQDTFSFEFRKLREDAHGSRQKGSRRKGPWGYKIIREQLEELCLPFVLDATGGRWVIRSKKQIKEGAGHNEHG